MIVQERYRPVPIGVNTVYALPGGTMSLAGFVCTTSGTLTVVDQQGLTILNSFPVTAGTYHPLPFFLESGLSGSITTAGGASGTLAFS